MLREVLVEFGLAEQYDLQQLVLIGLEVGQQADFLERLQRHALCLLDEQHHLLVFHVPLQQVILQQVHDFVLGGVARHRQRQLVGDDEEDVLGRNARVGDVDDFDRIRQLQLQHAAQHRLAAADLADHLDNALAAMYRVNQRGEDVAPLAALVEQARIRSNLKRGTLEAEVIFVHAYSPCSSRSMRP